MTDYNKNDIIILAKAIIENPLEYMDSDHKPYLFCHYCEAQLFGYCLKEEDFKHELHCPVLVAQDVLSGYWE
jgi:hypothetical protein